MKFTLSWRDDMVQRLPWPILPGHWIVFDAEDIRAAVNLASELMAGEHRWWGVVQGDLTLRGDYEVMPKKPKPVLEYLVYRCEQRRGYDREEPFKLFRTEEAANIFESQLTTLLAAENYAQVRTVDPEWSNDCYYEVRPIERGDE